MLRRLKGTGLIGKSLITEVEAGPCQSGTHFEWSLRVEDLREYWRRNRRKWLAVPENRAKEAQTSRERYRIRKAVAADPVMAKLNEMLSHKEMLAAVTEWEKNRE
jgi:hypothetical protein